MRHWIAGLAMGGLSVGAATAGVSQEEADELSKSLTPVGAVQAGDEALGLPPWEGGLQEAPRSYKGAGRRYTDPFPDDKPQFVITADNLDEYRDKLTVGQLALFERYPETYVMPVYETRRTFANPQFIYDATKENALNAELSGGGDTVTGAVTGVPFPIPKNGHEVIWNHKTRYRDFSVRRWNNQAAVTSSGAYNLVKLREDVTFRYSPVSSRKIWITCCCISSR